jgi:hypothetical protein
MADGDVPGMVEGMSVDDPGNDGAWVTVAEAARRLGVTPRAIRGRLDRGTIPWKPEGNDGRLVWVPSRDVPVPHPGTSPFPIPGMVSPPSGDGIIPAPTPIPAGNEALEAELRVRIQALEVEREALIEAGDRLVDQMGEARERAARLEGELSALREAHQRELAAWHAASERQVGVMREALGDLAGRLDRAEALLARPWWRRLLG